MFKWLSKRLWRYEFKFDRRFICLFVRFFLAGCETCDCIDEPRVEDKCLPVTCELDCKYGFQRDAVGCQIWCL